MSIKWHTTQFPINWEQIPNMVGITRGVDSVLFSILQFCLLCKGIQESPAFADKPARRESLRKLLRFDVLTTLSLTILAYLHAFNCCCFRNPRNPEKFTENSNLWSSRSSKVIDLGANGKPICDFILVINNNCTVSATVLEIFTVKDRKLLISPTPSLFDAP